MKKIKITPLAVALLASFAFVFAGCEDSGPFEDAGESVDETFDEAGDQIDDATD
jgi:hypothetical protein